MQNGYAAHRLRPLGEAERGAVEGNTLHKARYVDADGYRDGHWSLCHLTPAVLVDCHSKTVRMPVIVRHKELRLTLGAIRDLRHRVAQRFQPIPDCVDVTRRPVESNTLMILRLDRRACPLVEPEAQALLWIRAWDNWHARVELHRHLLCRLTSALSEPRHLCRTTKLPAALSLQRVVRCHSIPYRIETLRLQIHDAQFCDVALQRLRHGDVGGMIEVRRQGRLVRQGNHYSVSHSCGAIGKIGSAFQVADGRHPTHKFSA